MTGHVTKNVKDSYLPDCSIMISQPKKRLKNKKNRVYWIVGKNRVRGSPDLV